MRITNSIITNNTIRNVNTNKTNMNNLYTQLSTGKLIQKASENPIIAIRALRFRAELSELNQYLKKNIPDARSWMTLTEDALESVKDLSSSMVTYMVEAINGPLDTESKQAVITTLTQYRAQIHEDANSTYSGRSIFTGYKTNSTMTFTTADSEIEYEITETFTPDDLGQISKISYPVDISSLPAVPIPDDEMPMRNETYRIRLAYDKVKLDDLNFKEDDGQTVIFPITGITRDGDDYKDTAGAQVTFSATVNGVPKTYPDPYAAMANDEDTNPKAYLIADTGEIVMNQAAYDKLKTYKSFEIQYEKKGFEKGELRPENYFECICTTSDGEKKVIEYSSNKQDINYTVNFNQTLKVNTEGRDIFSHDIVRDIDELVDITQYVLNLEAKVDKLKEMDKNCRDDDPDKEIISSMLAAANKELDYASDTLKNMYGAAITSFTAYKNVVETELSDIGARCTRLTLNETRLSNQGISLEELKSTNEDADEAETIINLTTTNNIYEASLSAASKLLATSLLNYI